ncbi:hypothetical protein CAEBREN_31742 [Caenorhabditis brenneri]|uniref:C2H2-type domain-containing protein n=1 Tax=Caenorhabditis brenneri TaxID=135651 RepID=G0NDI8_CAEBE|nr:hypothetical protein CAEBREN_31742 [Caenorhabditis brenneri]
MSKQGPPQHMQQQMSKPVVFHPRTTTPDGSQVYLLQPQTNNGRQVQFIPVQLQQGVGNDKKQQQQQQQPVMMNQMMQQQGSSAGPSSSQQVQHPQQVHQQQQQQQRQQQQQQHQMDPLDQVIDQVGSGMMGNDNRNHQQQQHVQVQQQQVQHQQQQQISQRRDPVPIAPAGIIQNNNRMQNGGGQQSNGNSGGGGGGGGAIQMPGGQQRITLGNLHFQQDPNDPQKWIITNEGPPANQPPQPRKTTQPQQHRQMHQMNDDGMMNMSNDYDMGGSNPLGEAPKRCACTCPNCVQNTRQGDGKSRIHVCHLCNKTYGKTSHLRAHLRGHAGNKPFACDWQHCNKR